MSPTAKASSDLALLVQQQRMQQAVDLVNTLLDTEQPLKTAPCSQLIIGLCGANKYQTAIHLFRRIKGRKALGSLSLPAYHHLLRAAFRANQPAAGIEVFNEQLFRRRTASVQVYTSLISGLLKCSQRGVPCAQLAYEYWQRLLESKQPLDRAAYNAGLNACVEAGRPSEARQLLGVMRAAGHPPDTHAHNVMMKAHTRAGNADAARRLFKEMRTYGYRPDLVTYNTLMQAFIAGGELVRARAVLDKARREGFAPDAYSYAALMRGHAAAGQPREAEEILLEMQQQGVAPNVVAYGVAIDGWVEAGDMAAAQRLAQEAQSRGLRLNALCYNSLIKGHCHRGWGEAQEGVGKLLAQMGAAGVAPTVETYTTILDALLQSKDYAGAGALLAQMGRLGIPPDTAVLTCAMKLYARNGDPDTALRLFDEMLLAAEGAAAAADAAGGANADATGAPVPAARPEGALAAGTRAGGTTSAAASSRPAAALAGGGVAGSSAAAAGAPAHAHAAGTSSAQSAASAVAQEPGSASANGTGLAASSSRHPSGTSAAVAVSGNGLLPARMAVQKPSNGSSSVQGTASSSSGGGSSNNSRGSQPSTPAAAAASHRSSSGATSMPSIGPGLFGPDIVAWNALVDVLVGCGLMQEAEAALQRAIDAAAAAHQPVPAEAFGALIKGYKERKQQPEAVAALRRFLTLGGRPQQHMCDDVIRLCLQAGEFRTAAQVLRAMELTGLPVDRQQYQSWFRHHQELQQQLGGRGGSSDSGASRGRPSAGASSSGQSRPATVNLGMERLKWWLGLPNNYYSAAAHGSANNNDGV